VGAIADAPRETVTLRIPGRHAVLDAALALTIAEELERAIDRNRQITVVPS
jgi:UDP-N-acetylmuramate-alanine ligase